MVVVRTFLLGFVVLVAIMARPAAAQAPTAHPHADGQSPIRVPGTEFQITLGGDAYARSSAARQSLFAAIGTWLSAEFELPAVHQPPLIEIVPPERIVALRYAHLLPDRGAGAPSTGRGRSADERDTVAIYSDASRTIYLPTGWTGSTPAELSVLVHEIVHHMQNLLELKHPCPQERERLAYLAQERWLGLFNRSLEDEFGLDGLSLLVKTRCMH